MAVSRVPISQRPKAATYGAPKFSTELDRIFTKYAECEFDFDSVQGEVIALLNQIPAVEDWFEIVRILIIQCDLNCKEFLDPITTKLTTLDGGHMIKNGIGDKSRPLTIIKLLVHHVGFLLSSAVTNNTKQKNRKSIRDFLKNIFIVPTIFNGNENKNMFGWYLLLLRYQPNLSEYYKFTTGKS